MAPRIRTRKKRVPRSKVVARDGHFFPGEVVRILKLEQLDYRQLRRLFALIVGQQTSRLRGWSRFSLRDLAALRVAVELAGGRAALKRGRLRLNEVETACDRLRERYGIECPLLDIKMRRDGKTIVAECDGIHFEPNSEQLVIALKEVGSYIADLEDPSHRRSKRDAVRQAPTLEKHQRPRCKAIGRGDRIRI